MVLTAAAISYGLLPLISPEQDTYDKYFTEQLDKLRENEIKEQIGKKALPAPSFNKVSYSASWLVRYTKDYTIMRRCDQFGKKDKFDECVITSVSISPRPTVAVVAWDRCMFAGVMSIISLILYLALNYLVGGDDEWQLQIKSFYNELEGKERYIFLDVMGAKAHADALYFRSGVMLIAGILVAFLGVGVFAFQTGPSNGSDQDDYFGSESKFSSSSAVFSSTSSTKNAPSEKKYR